MEHVRQFLRPLKFYTFIQKSNAFVLMHYEDRGEIGLMMFCAQEGGVGTSVDNHLPVFATGPW
jgi:hypothetical protein